MIPARQPCQNAKVFHGHDGSGKISVILAMRPKIISSAQSNENSDLAGSDGFKSVRSLVENKDTGRRMIPRMMNCELAF